MGPVPALSTSQNLQPNSDINIPSRNLCCAEENVSAEATRTIDPHGVLAAVGRGAVKSNFTTLVAAGRINRPCRLIPSILEVLRHLSKGKRKKSQSKKGGFAEHLGGRIAFENKRRNAGQKNELMRKGEREVFMCSQLISKQNRFPGAMCCFYCVWFIRNADGRPVGIFDIIEPSMPLF